jgi:hypothetical protein
MRWIFSNLPNPSGRTMALVLAQPVAEMSTRNLKKKKKPGGKGRPEHGADHFARHLLAFCLSNVGASTSRNPRGLHGL